VDDKSNPEETDLAVLDDSHDLAGEVESDEEAFFDDTDETPVLRPRPPRRGGALAVAMLTMQNIFEGQKPDPIAVVVNSKTPKINPDADGISITIDDNGIYAPPLPRARPKKNMKKRKWGSVRSSK
jgi:hypothetical protein